MSTTPAADASREPAPVRVVVVYRLPAWTYITAAALMFFCVVASDHWWLRLICAALLVTNTLSAIDAIDEEWPPGKRRGDS